MHLDCHAKRVVTGRQSVPPEAWIMTGHWSAAGKFTVMLALQIRRKTFESSGVALTFEKLRIANAQHEKNCVSSPAAKVTISTDLPKLDKHENTNV